MVEDISPLIEATRNRFQVTLNYVKNSTGETVVHTGGVYEIGANSKGNQVVWLWDTTANDHIRQFLISNIESFQVLNIPFVPPQPWDIKIEGEIV